MEWSRMRSPKVALLKIFMDSVQYNAEHRGINDDTDDEHSAYSLQASLTPHAPPGGFSQTNIFGNLIHRPFEIRLSAKIPTLGEGVRALFPKWPPKYNI